MNQSIDVVSLVAGAIFVAVGVWLAADVASTRPSMMVLLPLVGIGAVMVSLATVYRARRWTR